MIRAGHVHRLALVRSEVALALPLHRVEIVVEPAPDHQLVVRADFDDLAEIHHHHLVGLADRRQPVRDDERDPAQRSSRSECPLRTAEKENIDSLELHRAHVLGRL